MTPIQTTYKGYRFRSRLEARWAVFFDALGLAWEYEAEGYRFDDGMQYLPDFLMHDRVDYFVEIKGKATRDMLIKPSRLALHHGMLVSLTVGAPWDCTVFAIRPGEARIPGAITCECEKGQINYLRTKVLCESPAALAAKRARFEFGECGAPA